MKRPLVIVLFAACFTSGGLADEIRDDHME